MREIAEIDPFSWSFAVDDEGPKEFAAFKRWLELGADEKHISTVLADSGIEGDIPERMRWFARREKYVAFQRSNDARRAQRLLLHQLEVLNTITGHYEGQLSSLFNELHSQSSRGVESTGKSIRILRDEIDATVRAMKTVIDATARVHSSIEPPAPLVQVKATSNAAAVSAPPPPPEDRLLNVYKVLQKDAPALSSPPEDD